MRESRQSDDALPIGLPQSDYLAHHSIMFTSRPSTWHIAFRVAGSVRAGLTALPQIIQPRCDSLRYPVTSRLCGSYFLSDRHSRNVVITAHVTTNHAKRLMAFPYAMPHAPVVVRLSVPLVA